MQHVIGAMEQIMKQYSDSIFLKSHMHLLNTFREGHDFVRMLKTVYYYIIAENQFQGTCNENCQHYSGDVVDKAVCKGKVYECVPTSRLSRNVFQVFSVIKFISLNIYLGLRPCSITGRTTQSIQSVLYRG